MADSLEVPSIPALPTAVRAENPVDLRSTRTTSKFVLVSYSLADQAFAIGGGFLANVVLARTQTKEEYGIFTLSYSVFTLLAGLHNAAILEPFTVYGSGRYRGRLSPYLWLMAKSNVYLGLLASAALLGICSLLSWSAPHLATRALVGLGLTVSVLFSGLFLRRAFYVQGQPWLATSASLVFFLMLLCALWVAARNHLLNSFSVFLVLALGWIVAGTVFGRRLAIARESKHFLQLEPDYWREHWKYAKWVLATAAVFQLTTQGYYWLLASFLSVKEVGELRAMYLVVTPVEQFFVAVSCLVIPVLASNFAAKRMGHFFTLWKRYAFATVAGTALFALAVRLLGQQAMHFLYAGKYDGLAGYLVVLAIFPLLLGIGNTMAHAAQASEMPRLVFYAYLSSGAATFLGGIPLVMHFGLLGAVYGILLSAATYSVVLGFGFLRKIVTQARQEIRTAQ